MSETVYYYCFDVSYYDEDTYKKYNDRGIVPATSYIEVLEKLLHYFGKTICDVHIWDVEMDTEDFLFERNFPGLMEMVESPQEGW